ncbi:hypothetical protein FBQ81_03245 [Chloroflexi bacterium CFX6]|nr:hypothetical protein [Chloroflexi bacterium CFX6]
MTISLYKRGQKVRCSVEFRVDGILTDPTTVSAKVKSPSGTVTTYVYLTDAALVRDSAGAFHLDVVALLSGQWHFRFEGTGTCTAVEESVFNVRSAFP